MKKYNQQIEATKNEITETQNELEKQEKKEQ